MIPVNDQLAFLERALRSVLDQDPGPERMQIEVRSDGADLAGLVRKIAGDRAAFEHNSQTLGFAANLNACIGSARGEWVHLLHADDMVRPGFYGALQEGIESRPEIGAAFCRFDYIDEQDRPTAVSRLERETPGILDRWIERIAVVGRIEFPAIVVRRSVYEKLGGLLTDLGGTACDWEMWVRIAARYPFWFEPRTLACFREHAASASVAACRTAANIVHLRRAIEAFQTYLPADQAPLLASRARDQLANRALVTARQFLERGHFASALHHLREAFLTSQSPAILRAIAAGIFPHAQAFLQSAHVQIIAWRQSPRNLVLVQNIRAIRRYLADQWLKIPPEFIEQLFPQELGRLHQAILQSGILNHPLTQDEADFLSRILEFPGKPLDHPQNAGRRLAVELYKRPG